MAYRFGSAKRQAPTVQTQAYQLRFADTFVAQTVSKVRSAADGAAETRNRFQPAQRPLQEMARRHQSQRNAAI